MSKITINPDRRLGFGCMRLPKLEDGSIDIAQFCQMVDAYLAAGFCYFDTAYTYHGGQSEIALKEALVSRHPRDSYLLATKLPAWSIQNAGDPQRIFDDQLSKTGAGYFDYYLLHSITCENRSTYDQYDCWSFGLQKKKEGKVRHFGFSFHAHPAMLDELLTLHPEVDFVQLQINYLDWQNPIVQSAACYEIARKHGKPVIIMEPVKGGTLASLSEELAKKLDNVCPGASPASWALRFCAELSGVMMILSGMSTPSQMNENLCTMQSPAPFTQSERRVLAEVTSALRRAQTIGCTSCRYCTDGCPQHISIPDQFRLYNALLLDSECRQPHSDYAQLVQSGGRAKDCVACGQCENACPQHLPIIDLLKKVSAALDPKA